MTKYVFPKGFLWGGAIAAHQAEGGKGLTQLILCRLVKNDGTF